MCQRAEYEKYLAYHNLNLCFSHLQAVRHYEPGSHGCNTGLSATTVHVRPGRGDDRIYDGGVV